MHANHIFVFEFHLNLYLLQQPTLTAYGRQICFVNNLGRVQHFVFRVLKNENSRKAALAQIRPLHEASLLNKLSLRTVNVFINL